MSRYFIFVVVFLIFSFFSVIYSQIGFPSFALAGGPLAGWQFNKTDDLNRELRNAGFPELSTNGLFILGGGGFIDIPINEKKQTYLRIGGLGFGFESNQKKQVNDTLSKAVNYNFGMGGISIEFVKSFVNKIDVSCGVFFSTGTLKIDLYQYGNDYGNYNSIFGELSSNGSTTNITRNYVNRFYAVQPQIGIGVLTTKFLYLRLIGGYQFATSGKWRVDNDIEVKNFPSGIKSSGFNISLSANFGIFFRDE